MTEVDKVNQIANAILRDVKAKTRALGLVQDRTETNATAESRMKRRETLSVPSLKIWSLPRPFLSMLQGTPTSGSAEPLGASFLASSSVEK
jgi:hypothetical protein